MVTPRSTHTVALAIEYGDRLVLGTVRDVHRAVARRVFHRLRVLRTEEPEIVHGTISTAVYDGLSLGARGAGAAARALAARGIGAPVERGTGGRQVVSAINGFVGADLLERDDPYAIAMAVRHDANDIGLDASTLAATYPRASSHLVLLMHGLGENDDSWRRRATQVGGTYASRIATETGATPILLRYNTGLHVSDNGARLAEIVGALVDGWPVGVEQLTLVGHSMGGLVIRAATNHAVASGARWPRLVRNVVCLGTPHLGAPLEKAVHLGGRVLAWFPETAPFGAILKTRSPGIVDLRHGYISQEEWQGQDLSARWGLDRIAAGSLPDADYHFVAATLGPTRTHVASVLGDLFVRFPSAAGRGRGGPVVDHAGVEYVESADHFELLNHPRIADWLVRWVNGAKPAGVRPQRTGEGVAWVRPGSPLGSEREHIAD